MQTPLIAISTWYLQVEMEIKEVFAGYTGPQSCKGLRRKEKEVTLAVRGRAETRRSYVQNLILPAPCSNDLELRISNFSFSSTSFVKNKILCRTLLCMYFTWHFISTHSFIVNFIKLMRRVRLLDEYEMLKSGIVGDSGSLALVSFPSLYLNFVLLT